MWKDENFNWAKIIREIVGDVLLKRWKTNFADLGFFERISLIIGVVDEQTSSKAFMCDSHFQGTGTMLSKIRTTEYS